MKSPNAPFQRTMSVYFPSNDKSIRSAQHSAPCLQIFLFSNKDMIEKTSQTYETRNIVRPLTTPIREKMAWGKSQSRLILASTTEANPRLAQNVYAIWE